MMTTIEQLLGDLLLRHNCVIVPSFGGFVTKKVSARIDYSSGRMFPPSKSLLFNKQLINNDGLLVNEFSVANDLSYDLSAKKVQEKVNEWNRVLNSGARIELDRIGYLFFDAEKNLCFEQDRFFNLLLESFGLGQVHFLTEEDVKIVEHKAARIESETKLEVVGNEPKIVVENKAKDKHAILEVIEAKTSEKNVELELVHPKRRKVWRYVAAACILPIAFYSIWIPMKTDVLESGMLSINDFNPFHSRTEGSYEQVELETKEEQETTVSLEEQVEGLEAGVDTYVFAYDDDTNISVSLAQDESIENNEFSLSESRDEELYSANTVHYIVGCFGDKTNATNLVLKLNGEGMDARIVDYHNGLHRVSAGGAISLEALSQIKSKANGLGFSGWTLK